MNKQDLIKEIIKTATARNIMPATKIYHYSTKLNNLNEKSLNILRKVINENN